MSSRSRTLARANEWKKKKADDFGGRAPQFSFHFAHQGRLPPSPPSFNHFPDASDSVLAMGSSLISKYGSTLQVRAFFLEFFRGFRVFRTRNEGVRDSSRGPRLDFTLDRDLSRHSFFASFVLFTLDSSLSRLSRPRSRTS